MSFEEFDWIEIGNCLVTEIERMRDPLQRNRYIADNFYQKRETHLFEILEKINRKTSGSFSRMIEFLKETKK